MRAVRWPTVATPASRANLGARGALLRTSSDRKKLDYDVMVVGSGAMGASVAYHLALLRPSLSVCVVEKDVRFTHASAMLSAGGIRQQFSLPVNIELSKYGIEFLRRAHIDLKVKGEDAPDMQLREQGYLFLASTPAGEATLRANHAAQVACGVDWTTLLSPSELAARFPWLASEGLALGCVGENSEGWFDPWAFVTSLRAKAKEMGVRFMHGQVVGLKCAAEPLHEPLCSGAGRAGKKRSVTSVSLRPGSSVQEGGEKELGVGTVVNCAGAFGARVVEMCGPGVTPLPVEARRRTIFSVTAKSASGEAQTWPLPDPATTPLVVCPANGAYFRPDSTTASGSSQAARYLCGASPPAEWPDPKCDSVAHLEAGITAQDHELFQEVVWPSVYARCPAFAGLKIDSAWSGFYEYNTLDQNGIIGRHSEVGNLVLCNGFSGHGLQQAPGAGRAVAELICAGEGARGGGANGTIDVSALSFDRVKGNLPLFESNIV